MLKKIITVVITAGITSTALASAGGEAGSLLSGEMLFKGINFLILLFLLHRWVKKPLVNVLNAAARNSKETMGSAAQALKDAEAKLVDYQAKVAGLEQQMAEMQQFALTAIEKEKERMIADAKNSAEALEKQSKLRIEQSVLQAKQDIREHLVAESIKLAETKVIQTVDAKVQKALVADYAKRLTETA